MRALTRLLLGDEAARALELLAGRDGGPELSQPELSQPGPAGQVRQAGAWCGTTPRRPI